MRQATASRLLAGIALAGGDQLANLVEPVQNYSRQRSGICPAAGELNHYEVLAIRCHVVGRERSSHFEAVRVASLNVQNQQKIEWPAQLVVAKAYIDQLERSQALPADRIAALRTAISGAEANKGKMAKLKTMAPSVEQSAGAAKSPADAARLHALAEILKHPSEKS